MLESIGHYQIRSKLGEGGMGVVYQGWDTRLGRTVAIKTFRNLCEDGNARKRLWSEARSLARVNHPRVCQVFDVLEEGEQVYVVLEFLEGHALSDRLASGAINPLEATNIILQILEALEVLHAAAIVHRDLKPSNAFLTSNGVKLLDFGIARSAGSASAGDPAQTQTETVLTRPGFLVGTPQYMAPEQIRGETVGCTADIFSAGCIFYEMLAGKRPFEGGSCVDVLYAVLHHEPPPLSGSIEIEALGRVIRRAIAKKSEERYPSARQMADAIEAVPLHCGALSETRTHTVARLIALPFRVLKSDEETDFLAFSLPDAISSSLSGVNSLIVRSSLMASRFAGETDSRKIAADADVDAILTGSLIRVGKQIRVTCQLAEAPSGSLIWSDTATSSIDDLFKIQDELSQRILQSLVRPLSERERRSLRGETPGSAKAYEYYLRANQLASVRSADSMRIAREFYARCLEEDPHYAPAWAKQGRVLHFLEKFSGNPAGMREQSDAAFRKAFAINPDLAIAHNLYTLIECDAGRGLQAMVRLLERARFRRNDPELFAGLVQACRYCDKCQASIAAHEMARFYDPHIETSVVHTLFVLGEYEKVAALPDTQVGHYIDCAALAALGDEQKALQRLMERIRAGQAKGVFQPIMEMLRAYLQGNREECLRLMECEESPSLACMDPEALYYVARQLAKIGEDEKAIELLLRVIEGGYLCATGLKRDPWLADLHRAPQFDELMRMATQRSQQAHEAFAKADGPKLLQSN
jgi:eukaryotic-like serine/threonine-protein kinase